jgi:hypothetical protein
MWKTEHEFHFVFSSTRDLAARMLFSLKTFIGESIVGIQHRPKSQRTLSKRRRKTRKHKNRSTKKYKIV